jgi:hypothetical protein
MVVLGDDNLMLLTPGLKIAGLDAMIRLFGFIPKLSVKTDPDLVVFLNMRPYPTHIPGIRRFAPRIGRIIARLGYAVEKQPFPKAYMHAVSQAFLKSCNHVPILNTYIKHLFDLTYDQHARAISQRSIQYQLERAEQYNVISATLAYEGEESAAFLHKVYGVTEEQRAYLESLIRKVKRLPCMLYDDLLLQTVLVDL